MPEPRKKIILGIDPGLADTGFGLITQAGQKLKVLDYGTIKTKAQTQTTQRLKEIYQTLNKILKKYQPDIIAVEKLFFAKNVKTALAVGQARGVILLVAGQHNIEVKEFTPLEIKMALSGYGQAEKKQIQQMVKIILQLKELPRPDDAADALATAICCSQHKQFS